jgi:hypothetical protein
MMSGVTPYSYLMGRLYRGGVVEARICKGRCSKKVEVGERSWLVGRTVVSGGLCRLEARKLCFWFCMIGTDALSSENRLKGFFSQSNRG